jgi:hypothetical protein
MRHYPEDLFLPFKFGYKIRGLNDLDIQLSKGTAASRLDSVSEAGLWRFPGAIDACCEVKWVVAEIVADICSDSVSNDDKRPEMPVECRQISN